MSCTLNNRQLLSRSAQPEPGSVFSSEHQAKSSLQSGLAKSGSTCREILRSVNAAQGGQRPVPEDIPWDLKPAHPVVDNNGLTWRSSY